MPSPLGWAVRFASSPSGLKVIGHAVRTARSEEGRKLIAQARRVATGPEGRRLIEEAKRVGKTAGQAATSAENRARLDVLRERLRAPIP
jgi:hypothetical protein